MYTEDQHPSYAAAGYLREEKGITFIDYYIIWSIWTKLCYMKLFSILMGREKKKQRRVSKVKIKPVFQSTPFHTHTASYLIKWCDPPHKGGSSANTMVCEHITGCAHYTTKIE